MKRATNSRSQTRQDKEWSTPKRRRTEHHQGDDAMKIAVLTRHLWTLGGLLAVLVCLSQMGCIMGATRAIPATRLPDIYKAPPKCEMVPVNLTLLRQEPPKE